MATTFFCFFDVVYIKHGCAEMVFYVCVCRYGPDLNRAQKWAKKTDNTFL